ncbi:hypothetical protein EUA93_08275 [Nocardioides oleivorans]|uniref:Uncharacterized protein n=1 Tax=Nocardioides oleivorans TaxID=273676 RepID=A0A4Q2RYH9_9ACTN|nr:hypothetical protein [Nocardioides oleivorans]RYB94340.1 hypothetical protein EUA93_08275 [Nocardioides oleivorans]
MKRESIDEVTDLTGRIKSLDQFSGSLVARRQPEADAIPITDAPSQRVPAPRRSRIFLRGGEGQGAFAELTLTAPRPRPASE